MNIEDISQLDTPLPDEIEAIKQGEKDFANGDFYTHDEVWG